MVALLYNPAINNGLSGLDDILMIEDNWDKLTDFSHIYTAFTDDVFSRELGSYYRPIQLLTYMPDAIISNSTDPNWKVFFTINIILFALASILLYGFLIEFKFSSLFSFIFTVLFVLHPALAPAISWVPGRVDTVLFIFLVSSIWSYSRYLTTKNTTWLSFHYLLFTLGMFTKETSIVIPFISILIPFYKEGLWSSSETCKWTNFTNYSFWKELVHRTIRWLITNRKIWIGWLLIVFIWFLMRTFALPDETTTLNSAVFQLINSWKEFIILISISLIPFDLQVFLEITWFYVLIALPGFLLFLFLPQIIKSSKRDLVFGVFWIFLFILPTTLSDYLNYHRLMIPLVGFAFILRPLDQLKTRNQKWILGTILLLSINLFLYQNLKFQTAFNNKTNFWANAVRYSPNSAFANNGLGWSYHLDEKYDSALIYYQRVIEIRPDRENVRMGMALIEEGLGNSGEADSLLQQEFKATKDSSQVYFYIGQIELERGDTAKAIKNLQLGFPATNVLRNARVYYDTLTEKVKNRLILE